MAQEITHVYLIHFFTGEYIDMYYPVHQIKYVLLDEAKAKILVEAENARLQKRQDYQRKQNAWLERVPVDQSLFE